MYKKYYSHIYAIKAELDLNCLNNMNVNCNTIDLDGNKYLYKSNKYLAPKKWKPFKLSDKFFIQIAP